MMQLFLSQPLARLYVQAGAMLALCAQALAATSAVPDGVTYLPAPASVDSAALAILEQAYSPAGLDLAAPTVAGMRHTKRLILGTFLSQEIMQDARFPVSKFHPGVYKIPLDAKAGVYADSPMLTAVTDAEAGAVADAIREVVHFDAKPSIRKLSKEEMALIWFYISWDIKEPIYVMESGAHKLVVEFDGTGTGLSWVEDIGRPCFQAYVGGNAATPCMCLTVVNKENQYAVGFNMQSSCKQQSDASSASAK